MVKRAGVWLCFPIAAMVLLLTACFQTVPRSPEDLVSVPPTLSDLVPTQVPTAAPVITPTLLAVPDATVVPDPPATTPPSPPETPEPTVAPTVLPVPPTIRPPVETPTPTQIPELLLEVHEPVDGTAIADDAVIVRGITEPGAAVTINDVPAILEQNGGAGVAFRGTATLVQGENEIIIVATDNQGNQATFVRSVTSNAPPQPPFLLVITEPRDLSIVSTGIIRLSGRTGPKAVVSVNGVSLGIDTVGKFSTLVALEPGPNIIDVVSTNSDGQVMSAVAAVIYRP